MDGLGNAYNSLRQYGKAIDFYQQVLPIFQQAGDKAGATMILKDLTVLSQAGH